MKTLKRLLLVLLAILLLPGGTLLVRAADAGTKGSITIKSSSTVSVAGKTFKAYKVMDVTLANGTNQEGGVAYTVPTEMRDFFAARYGLDKNAASFDAKTAEKIAEETDMQALAKELLKAAKVAGIQPFSGTGADGANTAVISELPLGYYVVEDEGQETPISALALTTTATDAVITLKADKPSVDKKIDGDQDTDETTKDQVESNNAAIGDKVPYVVTSRVPDMTGYNKYFFVLNDTLSKGLDFNDDVQIRVGQDVLVKDRDYTVTKTENADGTTSVKIVFLDFYGKYHNRKGEDIQITYSATLNEEAVIGETGNVNKVNLIYSNNPNVTPKGENEPEEDDPKGQTPDKITKTFVTGIRLEKTDKNGNRLTGAEFELEGTKLNTVLVKKDEFVADPDGEYWKLKDGSYTTETPTEGTKDKYESETEKYRKETAVTTVTKQENVKYKGVVGADGLLQFDGLAAGKYTITELKAPEGYNLLENPIEFTVSCTPPGDVTENCTWEVTGGNAAVVDGIIQITVENATGTELPGTGGIGTTLFYILGGMLVAASALLLTLRKRRDAERR